MAYISFEFYIFLIIVVALYYVFPHNARWGVLLTGSVLFYWYLSDFSIAKSTLLIGSSIGCWGITLVMNRTQHFVRLFLAIDLLIVITPLILIKEMVFVEAITKISKPSWWIVPVGLSFYSMQLISYIVDVYKKRIKAEKNIFKFILFMLFFPQIIQGPIPRYSHLAKQLYEGHSFDENKFVKGFMLIIWGFFLKLCIADKAGIVVNTIFEDSQCYQGTYVIVAGVLYSFQLYTDFLSCTTLAQGVAGLFGIDIIDNFAHPYFACSIKEFWRKWHISLSSWLKDYVYIPLGGNKKGKVRKYINLLVTFLISGIWHGAGYKFLFWGILHWLYQVLEELIKPLVVMVENILNIRKTSRFIESLKKIVTFALVTIAWVIFRANRLKEGIMMIRSAFSVYNPWVLTNDSLYELGLSWKEWTVLLICLMVLFVVSKLQEQGVKIRDKILKYHIVVRWSIYIGAIIFVMVFGTYGYGYDLQTFIYGGF